MMGILCTEIIHYLFSNRESLDFLKSFMNIEAELPRGWLASGYHHFIMECGDLNLKAKAFE